MELIIYVLLILTSTVGLAFIIERGLALPDAASRYTFSGIALYRSAFFAGCTDGVFPLKPLMLRSMAARRCSAQLYTGGWEDVGTAERLQALNAAG